MKYEKDLEIVPFEDEARATLDTGLIDWSRAEKLSEADPGSVGYRRLMREMGITGRPLTWLRKGRYDDDEDYY